MFCPKCGTQNPETGKFCRSCGTDLGNVAAVLSGGQAAPLAQVREGRRRRGRSQDPHDVYAAAIRNIISGIGFFIVSMGLLFTNVAGGRAWWWAMLFPAFGTLAKGISEYMKYNKIEKAGLATGSPSYPAELNQPYAAPGLPPQQTQFVSPESERYKTGDLVPPSVTDSTTRHLEMNPEGETITLPEK